MATHSSILSWRIPRGCKESDMTERLTLSLVKPQTKSVVQLRITNQCWFLGCDKGTKVIKDAIIRGNSVKGIRGLYYFANFSANLK